MTERDNAAVSALCYLILLAVLWFVVRPSVERFWQPYHAWAAEQRFRRRRRRRNRAIARRRHRGPEPDGVQHGAETHAASLLRSL